MKERAPCTIYIVRHGETDWNANKIIQGWSESNLAEEGKQQAKELAVELGLANF